MMQKTTRRTGAKGGKAIGTAGRSSKGAAAAQPQRGKKAATAASGRGAAPSARVSTHPGEAEGRPYPVPHSVAVASASVDALEASVDSLRRLLSELVEQRMEAVVHDLVEVRREATSRATDALERALDRLDEVLIALGAVRFEAEPMDLVDPLIHSVIEERTAHDTPAGVVIETVLPGYRSARGLVLSKAAVAISRGS